MLLSLTAERFRNLEPLEWSPGAGSHLLVGGNGAGKTSLLEAVYVLATTKSFRTAQLADCVRWGASGFRITGETAGAARVGLEVAWSRQAGTPLADPSGAEKTRAVNGKPSSLGEHLAALPVVAWTAGDADLTTGPPLGRRRFLDRGVVGLRPAAVDLLARYRRALGHKRELLAGGRGRGAGGGGRRRPTVAELAPWNELLAVAGAEIVALRRAYAERLAAELAEVEAEAALPFPALGLTYRPRPAAAGEGREAIYAALERAAGDELVRGRPLVGPHRDDLEVSWGGHPMRGTVSAGERKAAGLLLLAAHGRVAAAAGRPPVHLLDDADAELAPATLASLWRVFTGPAAAAGQLFATSNRPMVWRGLELTAVHPIHAGRVDPAEAPDTLS